MCVGVGRLKIELDFCNGSFFFVLDVKVFGFLIFYCRYFIFRVCLCLYGEMKVKFIFMLYFFK